MNKTILAIDTALCGVSVGLIAMNGHIVSRMVETTRGQAAILVPTIQEVLGEAELTPADIDLIACSIGPGSFTGLRIGLATARTMGLALNVPVIGLNTLDVMARHYPIEKPLLIMLETKRQDFYARYYDAAGKPLSEPFAASAAELLERAPIDGFSVGGDCLVRFQGLVSGDFEVLDNLTQLDPILMAQIGFEQFEARGDSGAPQPLYLRGADVSQPKNKPRRLAKV